MSAALLAACALVLLASAAAHLRNPGALASGIAAHGVLPPSMRTPLAWAVVVSEAVLGLAAAVAALTGQPRLALIAAEGCTVLFALMAVYLHRARRTAAPGVGCACGIGEAPLGLWVGVRATLLACLAGVATVSAGLALTAQSPTGWGFADRPLDQVTVLACAAAALAIGIGLLPAARPTPSPLPVSTLHAGGLR